MRTVAELNPLYAAAARATAMGSHSFYFATRFFPEEMARAAHAVYWFCRYTDDLVDECATVEQGRRDLEEWAEAVKRALTQGAAEHPVLEVFIETVARFGIPHEFPLELIEGMRMDLAGTNYRTFDELRTFCYRVASVVGCMMTYVIGFEVGALDYAIDLGIAMQLTNILRDVGEDLRRGRIYFPADELAHYGYSEADLCSHTRNQEFRNLMRFQVARARRYYEIADPGIALLDRRGRFAVKIAARVYSEILASIEQADFAVFDRRAVVPARRKYWITARHCATRIFLWRMT